MIENDKEGYNKDTNMMHHQAIESDLTNKIDDEHHNNTKGNSWEENINCDDSANYEHANVGINIDTHLTSASKSIKHLHKYKEIQNDDMLNETERHQHVVDEESNNTKYELKYKVDYEEDMTKNIQNNQQCKNKSGTDKTCAHIVKKNLHS